MGSRISRTPTFGLPISERRETLDDIEDAHALDVRVRGAVFHLDAAMKSGLLKEASVYVRDALDALGASLPFDREY